MPRLLAFVPHPDDESYSFGGLIALLAKAGWECHIQCATSGEKGKRHDGGPTDRDSVGAERERELSESCRILGAQPPVFWRMADGGLRAAIAPEERLSSALSAAKPDLVVSLGRDGAYGHPDHVALNRWVAEAWRELPGVRPPLLFAAFRKGLFLPQYRKCISMMGEPPNPPPESIGSDNWHYELPLAAVRAKKLASISAHHTQLGSAGPEALFPRGIIKKLLDIERFTDASGSAQPDVLELLGSLT